MKNTTISELKERGFCGVDVSLEISLFEYGFAWKMHPKHIELIYGVEINEEGDYYKFDNNFFDGFSMLNFMNEFSFLSPVDIEYIAKKEGITIMQWCNRAIQIRIYSMFIHFGYQCVFGESNYRVKIQREE